MTSQRRKKLNARLDPAPQGAPSGDRSPRAAAFDGLFAETVGFFHRLTVVAEQIHGEGTMSAGLRGVLRSLDRHGPSTVPRMARHRPVSRQRIQVLVNRLVEAGHVELIQNPAHKRSKLVSLTAQGQEYVRAMNRLETCALDLVESDVSDREMREAGSILRSVREYFEGSHWEHAMATLERHSAPGDERARRERRLKTKEASAAREDKSDE